jgi:hypothetical protein
MTADRTHSSAVTNSHLKLLYPPPLMRLILPQVMSAVQSPQAAEVQNQPRSAGRSNELNAIQCALMLVFVSIKGIIRRFFSALLPI